MELDVRVKRPLPGELDAHGGRDNGELHAKGVRRHQEQWLGRHGRRVGAAVDVRRGPALLNHRRHHHR